MIESADISREQEEAAFDKLRRKLERLAPWAREDDDCTVQVKLTVMDLKALLRMYRRHA